MEASKSLSEMIPIYLHVDEGTRTQVEILEAAQLREEHAGISAGKKSAVEAFSKRSNR